MHRLRRLRAGMPDRGDQAGYRARPREVAGNKRRIRQGLAEHYGQKGPAGRFQGVGGRAGQVQEILLRPAGNRRLNRRFTVSGDSSARPGTAAPVAALTDMPKLQAGYVGIAPLRRDKALILAKNVLYMFKSDDDEKCRYGCAPPSR